MLFRPKKHKFTGLEETETPAAAAPATYQPPTQEQVAVPLHLCWPETEPHVGRADTLHV